MRTVALSTIIGIVLVQATASANPDDAVSGQIAQARRLADASDHQGAIGILEDALIEAKNSDRRVIVDMLKRCYTVMASRAQASGQAREAARYRDNLEILEKASRGPLGQKSPEPAKAIAAPAQASPPRPSAQESAPVKPKLEPIPPRAVESPASLPRLEPPPLEPAPPTLSEPPRLGPPTPSPSADPAPAPLNGSHQPPTPPKPRDDLAEADRLFKSKQFIAAGEAYAALARAKRLPRSRTDHWAYCRWVAVVAALNAQPRSAREWEAIEAEVASIQRLAPGNWYGEYLRGKVAEIRGGKSRPADKVVVRGAEPDEAKPSRLKRLFGRADTPTIEPSKPETAPTRDAGPVLDQPLALPEEARAPDPDAASRSIATAKGSPAEAAWQIHETANFRIHHHDALLAARAGDAAETVRARQAEIWGSRSGATPWTPRCEIYLYPDGKRFAQATRQPENSPGFSTMSSDGQRVVGRKVSLRADHPQLLTAVLPHEVTHVVLADLFTTSQIPRWADEGIAVLAEPAAERDLRAAELEKPLQSGRVFNLAKLMMMDYPAPQDWNVYYAQSVSLTRFLVEEGAPGQFIEFVKRAHDDGIEPALREIYQIDGLAALEDRWLTHARSQFSTRTARAGAGPAESIRR